MQAALAAALLLSGCASKSADTGGGSAAAMQSNPSFDDALLYSFREFEGAAQDVAYALRALEDQVAALDLDSDELDDRLLSPGRMTPIYAGDLVLDDLDPADTFAVGVAAASAHAAPDWEALILEDDLSEVYELEEYDRDLDRGEDCWSGRGCEYLLTENEITSESLLGELSYSLNTDYRWVDLGLPDPATLAVGEEAVSETERWAILARGWLDGPAESSGSSFNLLQTFTLEVWLPTPGGVVRVTAAWNEYDSFYDDDALAAQLEYGLDEQLAAEEAWLDAQ